MEEDKKGFFIVAGLFLILIGLILAFLTTRGGFVSPLTEESEVKVIFVSPVPSPTSEATPGATLTPTEKPKKPTVTPTTKPKLTATPTPEEEKTPTPTEKISPTVTTTPEPTASPIP